MTRPIKKFNSMAPFATDPEKKDTGIFAPGTQSAAKLQAGKAKGAFNEQFSNIKMKMNEGDIKRVKVNPNLRDPETMTSVADISAVEKPMDNLGPYGYKLKQYDAKPKEYPGDASEKAEEEGKKKRDEEKNKAVENAKKQEQKSIGVPTEERTGSTDLSEYESKDSDEQPQTTEENDENKDSLESDAPESGAGMAAAVETPEQKMQRQAQNKMNMERFTDLLTTVTRVAGGASAGLTSGLEAAQKITMSFLNGGMLPPIGTAIATYNTAVMDIGDNVIKNTGEAFGIKDGKYNPDLAGTLKGAQYYKQKAAAQVEQAQAMGRTIDMLRGATGMDVNADNVTEVLQNMSPEQVRNLTALVTAEMNGTKMRSALSRMNAGQGTPADKVYVQSMKELNKQVSNAVKTTKKRTNADYRQMMAELQYEKRQNKLDLSAYKLEDDAQFEKEINDAYDEVSRLRGAGDNEAADKLEDQIVFTEYTREMIRSGKIKHDGNEAIMDMNAWNKIRSDLRLDVSNGNASSAEKRLYQRAVDITENAKMSDKGTGVNSWAENTIRDWANELNGDIDMPIFEASLNMAGNSKFASKSRYRSILKMLKTDPINKMPIKIAETLEETSRNNKMSLRHDVLKFKDPNDEKYRSYVEYNAAHTISKWAIQKDGIKKTIDKRHLTNDIDIKIAFEKLEKADSAMSKYLPLLNHKKGVFIFDSELNDPDEIKKKISSQKGILNNKTRSYDVTTKKIAKWRLDAYTALQNRVIALNELTEAIDSKLKT